jgi:integrase/recombinase XerC
MIGQLLGRRTRGPIFLSARIAHDDGTAPAWLT